MADDVSKTRPAVNSNEFKQPLGDSFPEVVRQLYSAAYRVHHSETCSQTLHGVAKPADVSFRLFAEEPKEGQTKI